MILEDVITQIRLKLEQTRREAPAESAAVLEKLLKDIEKIGKFINKEYNRINSDTRLNDKAKSTARRKALEQAGRKLEVLRARKTDPARGVERDKKSEKVSEAPPQAILKHLQEKEIRDRLYPMTEPQILSCFGQSLFSGGNPLLLDAILDAPPGFELLSAKVLEKLRAVRIKMLNSEPAIDPETAQSRHISIAGTLDHAKQELDRLRRKELPISIQEKTSKN